MNKRIAVEDGILTVSINGTTMTTPAGELTDQLIPMIARQYLEGSELAALDAVVKTFGGCRGIIVRDLPVLKVQGD